MHPQDHLDRIEKPDIQISRSPSVSYLKVEGGECRILDVELVTSCSDSREVDAYEFGRPGFEFLSNLNLRPIPLLNR